MHLNFFQREINIKIVYYGPSYSGKTTNLEQIYTRVDPLKRSDLISLKNADDRTIYFDFFQLELSKIGGMIPKIHLYTVPGQSYYESTRRLVLRDADGIVFIVDSSADRFGENMKSWIDLQNQLAYYGSSITTTPVVVQLNKRDLPNALGTQDLVASLGIHRYRSFPAVAAIGQGVFDTLREIIKSVMSGISREMAV